MDLIILQGATFRYVTRWGAQPFVYKKITAISQEAPARLTVPAHGLVNGWYVAVSGVKGMAQINSNSNPPHPREYQKATVIDADTIELNKVNASEFKPYLSGGYIQYLTPVDMDLCTARLQIRATVESTDVLFELSTGNGRITIDNVAKTISMSISAVDTAALSFTTGVYDLEIVTATGDVTRLLSGAVNVVKEVSRP